LKTFTVVIATSGGNMDSVTTATDPVGKSLIGNPSWTFTV
jgi:hypothetical protein